MSEVIFNHLRNVPLFKGLTDDELQSIVDISYTREYIAKSFVFMQGESLDRVFFIHSGKIKIHINDQSGKEQIVSIPQAGEMFPHVGLFLKGTFPAHAEVIKAAKLIVLPIADFELILIKHPELCIKLFKFLSEKIVDLQARLVEQTLHNSYDKITMLLRRLCKSNGIPLNSNQFKITTHFTNRELANMIGTSRETVNRTINQLRKKEVISMDSEGFFIINIDKLENELY
ncbi:Crp/Fnr family transcriptional regulator [Bacillus sp. AFS017336]|uniref:Crp/Fnr family transcriptional regulator n=1 Tax=Bacillus sp. AFS017336 TaxID=2033489 RepID=UPI000BF11AC1|nr:Crp/Fnr family transcriptional regulator [Bacillus sp. AFS017336]PEK99852.1 Crp/Fnr family transcriptional regulator [Bacillus sp. AFS017336]